MIKYSFVNVQSTSILSPTHQNHLTTLNDYRVQKQHRKSKSARLNRLPRPWQPVTEPQQSSRGWRPSHHPFASSVTTSPVRHHSKRLWQFTRHSADGRQPPSIRWRVARHAGDGPHPCAERRNTFPAIWSSFEALISHPEYQNRPEIKHTSILTYGHVNFTQIHNWFHKIHHELKSCSRKLKHVNYQQQFIYFTYFHHASIWHNTVHKFYTTRNIQNRFITIYNKHTYTSSIGKKRENLEEGEDHSLPFINYTNIRSSFPPLSWISSKNLSTIMVFFFLLKALASLKSLPLFFPNSISRSVKTQLLTLLHF